MRNRILVPVISKDLLPLTEESYYGLLCARSLYERRLSGLSLHPFPFSKAGGMCRETSKIAPKDTVQHIVTDVGTCLFTDYLSLQPLEIRLLHC